MPNGTISPLEHLSTAYDFEIIYKKCTLHTNVDALSRPPPVESIVDPQQVLAIAFNMDDSAKNLDPYEDEALLHFLKNGRHMSGASRKQVSRIDRLEKHYMCAEDELLFRRDIGSTKWLIVPPVEQRNELVRIDLLGHFKVGTTLRRLQDSYYWKNMDQDVKCIVGRCMTCQRHERVPAVNHPALAIIVTGIHDRISVDLILGLPQTDEGYLGIITICESLSKRVEAYPIKSKAMGEI
jgi:hypothetical protein